MAQKQQAHRVCPYWMGYFLINPFRKFRQNPEKILQPHIEAGMTVLEIGPGMGFFSLTLARLVGNNGKLICVDVQEKMLTALKKRAAKKDMEKQIETRLADRQSLNIGDLKDQIDCAVAFYVVHEVPDVPGLFKEIHTVLKPGAKLLIAEPKGHVSKKDFEAYVTLAVQTGFQRHENFSVANSRGIAFVKHLL